MNPIEIIQGPVLRPATTSRPAYPVTHVLLHVTNGEWQDRVTGGPVIPGTVTTAGYRLYNGEPYLPVVLPSVETVPLLARLEFYCLPIRSPDEIKNIDAYKNQLTGI